MDEHYRRISRLPRWVTGCGIFDRIYDLQTDLAWRWCTRRRWGLLFGNTSLQLRFSIVGLDLLVGDDVNHDCLLRRRRLLCLQVPAIYHGDFNIGHWFLRLYAWVELLLPWIP